MHKIEMNISTGELTQIEYTAQEQTDYEAGQVAWAAGKDDREAATVRAKRNVELAASDWTQITDCTANKALWATYRQALRDISGQVGFPWDITWPEP